MNFFVRPITEAEAREISLWSYPEPYEVYEVPPSSVPSLLDPVHRCHAVMDERGQLAGYFCFGRDATVPEGKSLGLYDDAALDVGLGLKPDLTGRGLGAGFVRAGARFAEERYGPPALRLTVACFDRRAVKVYEAVGFDVVERFGKPDGGCLIMRRKSTRP